MGLFDKITKLVSDGGISIQKTTHSSPADDLLTEGREAYVGEWRGPTTTLLIKADGTVEYRHEETIGDTTNSESVSGPINAFDGASFTVGVMGNNTHFEVAQPPTYLGDRTVMILRGEELQKQG